MFLYNNPWKDLEQMQREMNSLFTTATRKKKRTFPPVNLYDNEHEVVAEFVLPGLTKKEIDISFENGTLLVKGERSKDENETHTTVRNERAYGAFKRSVEIPVSVEVDNIGADLSSGILTITLPKSEEAKPKKIRMGNVNKDPPPAMVFIDPAIKPIKINPTISNNESI